MQLNLPLLFPFANKLLSSRQFWVEMAEGRYFKKMKDDCPLTKGETLAL